VIETRSLREWSSTGARSFECVNGSRWWCASSVCKRSRGPSRH
jgi:hypothetical protein